MYEGEERVSRPAAPVGDSEPAEEACAKETCTGEASKTPPFCELHQEWQMAIPCIRPNLSTLCVFKPRNVDFAMFSPKRTRRAHTRRYLHYRHMASSPLEVRSESLHRI